MRQGELERILDLGLPSEVFSQLAARARPLTSSKRKPPLICSYLVPAVNGLSGKSPLIFLNGDLSEPQKVSTMAEMLFELGRSMALWDIADLNAWIEDELQFRLFEVNSRFLEAYMDERSMLKIESNSSVAALGSFVALNRLVLTDG